MRAEAFAAAALDWVDVPYRHQGRSRLGADCVGLALGILAEAGELPAHVRPRANYGRRPMPELVRELNRYCRPTTVAVIGSLVTCHWQGYEQPGHMAIVTGPPQYAAPGLYLVHAHMRARRVVVNSYVGHWLERTTGVWLMPGVEYPARG